jgi:nicotinamidase-related amidase
MLVIDAQTGLLDGSTAVYDADALVRRILALLQRARSAQLPIIYTQDKDVGPINSREWAIHTALAPRPDDLVIPKAYADSFYQTSLHTSLAGLGVRQLIVVGCKTDACVEMTCRRAVALGYDVTLVSDGHSTTDNRFMTAAQSIEYYDILLDGFGAEDGFGGGLREIRVVSSGELDL